MVPVIFLVVQNDQYQKTVDDGAYF
ncbi:MAG: hypothetical protein PWP30_2330, partial [Eubacteriaceae bacterium]|nr:hypothetical protein [Eubacteriaceae bacterium]